jgi:hypothetical protein
MTPKAALLAGQQRRSWPTASSDAEKMGEARSARRPDATLDTAALVMRP